MNTIHTFNTGRQYTNDGQVINWTQVAEQPDAVDADWVTVTVVMQDTSRGLDYTLTFYCLAEHDDVTDARILNAYDANNGTQISLKDLSTVTLADTQRGYQLAGE